MVNDEVQFYEGLVPRLGAIDGAKGLLFGWGGCSRRLHIQDWGPRISATTMQARIQPNCAKRLTFTYSHQPTPT